MNKGLIIGLSIVGAIGIGFGVYWFGFRKNAIGASGRKGAEAGSESETSVIAPVVIRDAKGNIVENKSGVAGRK